MKCRLKIFSVSLLVLLYGISVKTISQTIKNDLVFIKGGKFMIGSKSGDDDEKNGKKTYINDFLISKYEITNSQYCSFLNHLKPNASDLRKFINLNGHYKNLKCRIYLKDSTFFVEKDFENFPVNYVSWFGADAYCKLAGGRLPTEAEWEYVAKGGKISFFRKLFTEYAFSGSNNPDEVAWYRNNSEGKLHEVGQKKANSTGVYDMSGNVAEWCSDWYNPDYYRQASDKNPGGPETGKMKVHRGGSRYNTVKILRLTNRRASKPVTENAVIGFRLVKDSNL